MAKPSRPLGTQGTWQENTKLVTFVSAAFLVDRTHGLHVMIDHSFFCFSNRDSRTAVSLIRWFGALCVLPVSWCELSEDAVAHLPVEMQCVFTLAQFASVNVVLCIRMLAPSAFGMLDFCNADFFET